MMRRLLLSRPIIVAFVIAADNLETTGCSGKEITPARKLKHVVLIMRHGDRSPVTKSVGPKFPHTKENDDFWRSRMISGRRESVLKKIAAAQTGGNENIYTGRDIDEAPYGQLSNIGVDQLYNLGAELRAKYVDKLAFLPRHLQKDSLYTRSTNVCRTMNSLRSFLVGLYGFSIPDDVDDNSGQELPLDPGLDSISVPPILSFPAGTDPMIDNVTETHETKEQVRRDLLRANKIPFAWPGFKGFHGRLKNALGYDDRANFLIAREQLVCWQSHGLQFPEGLAERDIETLYDFELWATRRMFSDKRYQSIVVGAFKEEIYDRLTDIKKNKVEDELLSVYSSHDYTIIPLMVALGIEMKEFPKYGASLTIEIAEEETDINKDKHQGKSNGKDTAVPEDNLIVRLLFNGNQVIVPGIARVTSDPSSVKGLSPRERELSLYLEKGPWYKLSEFMSLLIDGQEAAGGEGGGEEEANSEERKEKKAVGDDGEVEEGVENMGPGKDEAPPRSKL